jgi:hypothetical protein|tara:strand:- start:725 stop:2371 length:1647 start_codon:yes stop_codon:yes gene_type:complete
MWTAVLALLCLAVPITAQSAGAVSLGHSGRFARRRASEIESGAYLRASELKKRLRAVGVDITGIIDKEGLVKLYDALDEATKRRASNAHEPIPDDDPSPRVEVEVEVDENEPEEEERETIGFESANMWDELRKRAQKVGVDVPGGVPGGGGPSAGPSATDALQELLRRFGVQFPGKGGGGSRSTAVDDDAATANRRQFLKLAFFLGTGLAISHREDILNKIGDLTADDSTFQLPMVYEYSRALILVDASPSELPQLMLSSGAPESFISSGYNEQLNGIDSPQNSFSLRSKETPGLAFQLNVASKADATPIGVDGVIGADNLRRYAALELDWGGGMSSAGVWSTSTARFHQKPWEEPPNGRERWEIPFLMAETQRSGLPVMSVSIGLGNVAGDCPGGCVVRALVDTGSPVTVITPQLAKRAGLEPSVMGADKTLMMGWRAVKTKVLAYRCPVVVLGASSGAQDNAMVQKKDYSSVDAARCFLKHTDLDVYVGLTPAMKALGFEGRSAMVLGLDLLRPIGTVNTMPPAAGGPKTGKLVLDYYHNRLVLVK